MKKAPSELILMAKGISLCFLLCTSVLLLLGFMNKSMLLGLLFGSLYTFFNFLLLALAVKKSLSKHGYKAQSYMTGSYFIRLFITGFVILIGLKTDYINAFGLILPLFFPKAIILISSIHRKGGNNERT